MIDEIRIRDLGVIAEAHLPLGPGFTAITGETGAGKTMVVTALGLLRGERAETARVRSGSHQAWVEGRWLLEHPETVRARVEEAGATLEGNELLMGRSVSTEGRSRAVVCGRSTPIGTLGEIGDALVAVHGQSEQVRLRSSSAQREMLDRFAGEKHARLIEQYGHAYRQWHDNQVELQQLITERDNRAREADDLRQAMSEIEATAPQPGEDAELAALAERLTNSEELRTATAQAREALSDNGADGGDALALIESARRTLDRVAEVDTVLAEIRDSLDALSAQVGDAAHRLSSHLASLEGEGVNDLDLIQQRRADIALLMRRYGPTLDDVLAYLDSGSRRLFDLDSDNERINELQADVQAQETSVWDLATQLRGEREQAAVRLSADVTTELAALAMPDAQLFVRVAHLEIPGPHGADTVEILLRPHPGSEPMPVSKGASGGELSRVMLALEVVIASVDTVPTFVFDEIDAGVGGAAAIEIGKRLARLAQRSQVIVVTHLAQVAAFANNHLNVQKDTSGSFTESSVYRLQGEEREAEMARLLSGLSDSETGLAHARELLTLAGQG
ncbi:MAG: DNA repair protein RecN [Actinobacteria bacterium]|uniref:DNA repair protein RecN n=1 Tax=freshwater metagenome TaxID=449393 RepID=A0A6J7GTZ4_9ZZZZ|nr:DNA repair protein RecN [Actinomycetota bacterium]